MGVEQAELASIDCRLAGWALGGRAATPQDRRERWYCSGNTENQFAEQQARTVNAADKVLSPLAAGHELARNAHLAGQWGDDIGGRLPAVFQAGGADEQWKTWMQAAGKLGASRIVGLVASGMEAMKEYPHVPDTLCPTALSAATPVAGVKVAELCNSIELLLLL